MLKTIIICSIFLFSLRISAHGQSGNSVTLKVIDGFSQKEIKNASVSFIRSADSILVKYGWTDSDGVLKLNALPVGKLIVTVRFPMYADYVRHIVLDSSSSSLDLGLVKLSATVQILQEVVIKSTPKGLILDGDTLQYDSKSFVIEKNAKVEDLLRQIPGLQIDNFGKITAYGTRVQKVLVDGEEFFGDDPTLVTRNIRGDMVKSVQIYDKKSDQATFTGIDDGIKTKTINVKLKEDKKKGFFGQATASYGTKQYYQDQFMFNLFRNKSKFSVFGNLSNSGKIGLTDDENYKYGINALNNNLFLRGIIVSLRNYDGELGSTQYDGQGNPIARTSGIHFDTKWNENKERVNLNFLVGSLSTDGEKHVISRNELPSTVQITKSDQSFDRYFSRSKFDGTYSAELDDLTSLQISIDGKHKKKETITDFKTLTIGENTQILNNGHRKFSVFELENSLNASEQFMRKFKIPRRTLMLQLNQSTNKTLTDGYLNAQNQYFVASGSMAKIDNINQFKTSQLKTDIVGGVVSYTEPVSKLVSLISSYGAGWANSRNSLNSYDETSTGIFDQFDPLYSNNFKMSERSQKISATLAYNKGEQRIQLSNEINDIHFKQVDLTKDFLYSRHFTNYLPSAFFYNKWNSNSLRINYMGSPVQPAISQIQPSRTNADPLNIFVGNPDLIPAYKHSFSTEYILNKQMQSRIFLISSEMSIVKNPLINSYSTNTEGISTIQTVNYSGGVIKTFNLSGMYRMEVKPLRANATFFLTFSHVNDYGIVNAHVNTRNSELYSARFSISKYKLKKHQIYLNLKQSYLASTSTLNGQFDNSGFIFNGDLNATFTLFKTMEISAQGSYNHQAKTLAFNKDYQLFLINGSISKKFLKNENVKFSVSVNDLLNQNNGFTRSSYGTMLTQTDFSTIKRYVMFSLIWDFSKFGTLK